MKTELESLVEWTKMRFPVGMKVVLPKERPTDLGRHSLNLNSEMTELFGKNTEYTVLAMGVPGFPHALRLNTREKGCSFDYWFEPEWLQLAIPMLTPSTETPKLEPIITSESTPKETAKEISIGTALAGSMAAIFGLAAGKTIFSTLAKSSEDKSTHKKLAEKTFVKG